MQTEKSSFACVLDAWGRHEIELRAFLTHRVGDPHAADDLLQDVFLKAMRQGRKFCSLGSARAWLFEVARNALVDRFRMTREQVELPEDLPAVAEEVPTVDMLSACLPRVLSELSEQDREALTLCDLEGMTQEEFGLKKGLSLPAAKSRLQRARKRLREHLTQACQVQFDDSGRVMHFVPRSPRPANWS